MAKSIEPKLISSIKQGRYILGRNANLDVVNIVENIAATSLEYLQIPPHVFPDLIRFGKGEYVLGIYTSAPKS